MTRNLASAKRRGAETQRLVAGYLAGHGWPYAEPVGAGMQGADITGTPGLLLEVKARRSFDPGAWLRQARGHGTTGLPLVVLRPDGAGPASLDDWPVIIKFSDMVGLLHAAGYGTTPAEVAT